VLFYARRYQEAIAVLDEVLQLDERADNARTFRARAYLHSGQKELALAERLKLRASGARAPGSAGDVGQALAMLGRLEEARAELRRLVELEKQQYVPALDIATVCASLDEREEAIRWLERALADRSTNVAFLGQDPAFDALRDDPRFIAIVERISTRMRRDLLPASRTEAGK
jgi:serine/threonine-protein kinase